MFHNPFEQFIVHLRYAISFSSTFIVRIIYITDTLIANLWYFIHLVALHIVASFRKTRTSKSLLLNILKLLYSFINNLIDTYLPKKGKSYFPFFMYLFIYICTNNLVGILPYAFTTTSHLSITFTLSFIVWYACVMTGFSENGLRFLAIFFATGIPFMLLPFLVGIELISFIFRSVSLALRLFANIVAGHISLDTLAVFLQKMLYPTMVTLKKIIIFTISFIMSLVLVLFELVVAVLQGYIFVVLSFIYFKDIYSVNNH